MNSLTHPLNELALFAGAGGGILGGLLCGFRTVCAVEWDSYARDVLVARQNDGCLEAFPIWDDIQTFDGRPWRGVVDVVSGGFPCQDISSAGKGAGIEGERSGMWKHMARVIGEVLPRFVLVENSPMLVGRGLAVVLADLAEMGYDAEWCIVGAHDAGAPHKRDRIWLVAHTKSQRKHRERSDNGSPKSPRGEDQQELNAGGGGHVEGSHPNRQHGGPIIRADSSEVCGEDGQTRQFKGMGGTDDVAHAMCNGGGAANSERGQEGRTAKSIDSSAICDAPSSGLPHGANKPLGESRKDEKPERSNWWATEPDVGRVAHGLAARVDRLRCIGNGQVPAVVALAWRILKP